MVAVYTNVRSITVTNTGIQFIFTSWIQSFSEVCENSRISSHQILTLELHFGIIIAVHAAISVPVCIITSAPLCIGYSLSQVGLQTSVSNILGKV